MALVHGRATLAGFRADPMDYPDPLGLGPQLSMGLMLFAELYCALAVAGGLLTRLALLPLVFGMGTAFFVYHAGDPFSGMELAFLYLVVFSTLLITGPGRFSLDKLLFGRRKDAGTGAAVTAALLAVALGLAAPVDAASRIEGDLDRRGERPLEEITGVDSVYGVLETPDGVRLRTVLTRPAGAEVRLPAILFVQWLSCDSIELPSHRQDGWSRMLRRVVGESGMVMLRTEKAGVGDSEGPPCDELGYERELRHHRAALAWLSRHPWVDPERIVVFGASMGATMAPLLAAESDVAGVVVWGGGARTWFERTLAFERNFRELSAVPAEQLTGEMKLLSEFLVEYLIDGRAPGDIVAADERLGHAWGMLVGTGDGTHYGRPVRFHQEAQAQDWAAAWAAVEAPVLVLYGEYDWYEDPAGHELIVRLVNRSRAGRGRLKVFPKTDHHFQRFSSPQAAVSGDGGEVAADPVAEEILAWLRRLGSR